MRAAISMRAANSNRIGLVFTPSIGSIIALPILWGDSPKYRLRFTTNTQGVADINGNHTLLLWETGRSPCVSAPRKANVSIADNMFIGYVPD
jgi:hypothetical protein